MPLSDLTGKYRALATQYSNRFELIEQEGMMLIKISSEANNKKMGIFVDCGKYGSDWLAMSSCDILIHKLLQTDQLVDYWIIPVINPDGYEYTWSTDRLWVSLAF